MSYSRADYCEDLVAEIASTDINAMTPDELEDWTVRIHQTAKDVQTSFDENGYMIDDDD